MAKESLRDRINLKRLMANSEQRQELLAQSCSFFRGLRDTTPHIIPRKRYRRPRIVQEGHHGRG